VKKARVQGGFVPNVDRSDVFRNLGLIIFSVHPLIYLLTYLLAIPMFAVLYWAMPAGLFAPYAHIGLLGDRNEMATVRHQDTLSHANQTLKLHVRLWCTIITSRAVSHSSVDRSDRLYREEGLAAQ
jgi:hypothetical protein